MSLSKLLFQIAPESWSSYTSMLCICSLAHTYEKWAQQGSQSEPYACLAQGSALAGGVLGWPSGS